MHLTDNSPTRLSSEFSPFLPHLKSVDWRSPVAIAVSGGGDSMALLASVLHLRLRDALTAPLHVLTVDHGLRSGSAGDAVFVADFCNRHDVHHAVLTWSGAKPSSAVAERARVMRRDLLLSACRTRGVRQLLLGHTLDDVAETLLMRVRRGGLRGHAGIAPETRYPGLRVLRPFLSLRRDQLRTVLRRSGIQWIDDPTNENMQFERPRARQKLQCLDLGDFKTERVAAYASLMGRWRAVMARHIATVIDAGCKRVDADVHLHADVLRPIPHIIAVETLRELVRFVGGDAYMVDFSQAKEAVRRLIADDGDRKAFSTGRCVLSPGKSEIWTISRAQRDLPVTSVEAGQSVPWDGRFIVQLGIEAPSAGEIRPAIGGPIPGSPIVQPETFPHKIIFRPRVLDGPVASFDEPVFKSFEGLLVR
ncbi:tRNA lysidine(34) synthetase TilS [Pararhizobium sp. IMCC21322]|uniref:tRNA lysidine(34) synthetase TilS n=1 Tax=Pararhizobium sp. IMCC21322 TaxID=3067903 RepID=UPI002740BE53|nr:tRNA lysidine(34) synthetase TilS [Pararhizobium sp. IMCC21322]